METSGRVARSPWWWRAATPRWDADDFGVLYDLARRLSELQGLARLSRAVALVDRETNAKQAPIEAPGAADGDQDASPTEAALERLSPAAQREWRRAHQALEDARFFAEQWAESLPGTASDSELRRVAGTFALTARLHELVDDQTAASLQWEQAATLDPAWSSHQANQPLNEDERARLLNGLPPESLNWVLDVWTWKDAIYGRKLVGRNQQARLIVLHLQTEFLATRNMPLVAWVQRQVESARREADARGRDELQIELSGSAAVGSEMLQAARDGIRHTEWCTAALVVLVLLASTVLPCWSRRR